MARLKADFHAHCADDPRDQIDYSAETLIDQAAGEGIEVLALTCHRLMAHTPALETYAHERGILLIPGLEAEIEGKHVLILNPSPAHLQAKTFAELRAAGKGDAVFIAPHPYFPSDVALGRQLETHADVFDAVEYSAFYVPGLNFNRRAMAAAARLGLPLVGCTDTHVLPYCASTCTWLEAAVTLEDVLAAIREGRIELETRARPVPKVLRTVQFMAAQGWRDLRAHWSDQEAPQ